MKTIKNIIVAIVLIVSLLVIDTKAEAEPLEINPANLTIDGQIKYYSELYRTDPAIVEKVIQCESNYKTTAVGDNGLSKGISQFQYATFIRFSKKLGEELDYNSSHDQIKLLTYAISIGSGREWTAFRAIENGGKYSFYSKQLKKHFTIYCR